MNLQTDRMSMTSPLRMMDETRQSSRGGQSGVLIPALSLAIVIAMDVAFDSTRSNRLSLLSFGVLMVLFLRQKLGIKDLLQGLYSLPASLLGVILILPLNALLRSAEALQDGELNLIPLAGVRVVTFILILGGLVVLQQRHSYPVGFLALVFAAAGICAINLVGNAVGYRAGEVNLELENSAFGDMKRLVTPLTPAWYLSGELRWALPMTALLAMQKRTTFGLKLLLIGLIPLMALLMLRLGYRGAIYGPIFMLAWLMVGSIQLRRWLCYGAISYLFIAPLIWTSDKFQTTLSHLVPDMVLNSQLIGKQDLASVFGLSGRTDLWEASFAALEDGVCLWRGVGFSAVRNLEVIGYPWTADDFSYSMESFLLHQGFLEMVFIYGLIPTGLIICLWGWVLMKSQRKISGHDESRGLSASAIGLFSVALVSVANSQDCFFMYDNFYLFLVIISLYTGLQGWRIDPVPTSAGAVLRMRNA